MRAVIQRTTDASVKVNNEITGQIGTGLVVLLGVEEADTTEDADYLVRKIANMRIFEDDNEKMNLSLNDVHGAVLSISQFTLHADTKKGNRPSFTKAAKPEKADELYKYFNENLREQDVPVETGSFGAHMEVQLMNDGPVTIMIDSKNK
ncbi:MAG: D-tyrosyl-tRNA(Tyr) deacylase [Alkalibacterium sp.]|nr:D-tyrosyl-tRNA(Tyr) deacylase [Alkalibacterium sp.]